MLDRPIGFMDSGVGGLSVLRAAVKAMPEENFIYYGDSRNAPYGEKTREEVRKLTLNAVDHLLEKHIKALVIACNTATSVTVDELRKTLDIPVVSIEPAIKPALEQTDGRVLLLATDVTLASPRVNRLIDRFDFSHRVVKVSCQRLAAEIEREVLATSDLENYLTEILDPYRNCGATAAVLGCTHYPFIRDRISRHLGGVAIFDGIDGTVRHLKNLLTEQQLKRPEKEKGTVTLESSLSDDRTIALYHQVFCGGKL